MPDNIDRNAANSQRIRRNWQRIARLINGGGLVPLIAETPVELARMGAATLVAGTVTVNNEVVGANSRIFLTGQNSSGTHGELTVSARVAGTSFTITSTSATDTRLVAWIIADAA